MQKGVLCSDIYKVLAAPSYQFNMTMYDESGEGTIDPSQAQWFYVQPVNFMIQVPDSTDIGVRSEVYLWKSSEIKTEQTKEVLERLKHVCNQYGFGFTIYDFGNGNLPKKFSHLAMRNIEQNKVNESMNGSKLRSYFTLPRAKMIVVHSSRIEEEKHGARARNIKEIFVECNGERRRLSTNNLNAAKAMTRHLSEGGAWGDKFGKLVQQYSTDLELLKALLAELEIGGRTAQVSRTKQFISNIKDYLKRASTTRGYKSCIDELPGMTRVGNTHVQNYAKRLSAVSGSAPHSQAYARLHLLDSCSLAKRHMDAMLENLDALDESDIAKVHKSVKHICLGTVPMDFSSREDLEEGFLVKAATTAMGAVADSLTEDDESMCPSDIRVAVIAMAEVLAEIVRDDHIRAVLLNIMDKPAMQPSDAELVMALNNSCTGMVPARKVLVEPELHEWTEFKNWANGKKKI